MTKSKITSKRVKNLASEWNKNNNTSSHMLLDHCYAFGLSASSLRKKIFQEGGPLTSFSPPWVYPWANMAETP